MEIQLSELGELSGEGLYRVIHHGTAMDVKVTQPVLDDVRVFGGDPTLSLHQCMTEPGQVPEHLILSVGGHKITVAGINDREAK